MDRGQTPTKFFVASFPYPSALEYSERSFAADHVFASGFCEINFDFTDDFLNFDKEH